MEGPIWNGSVVSVEALRARVTASRAPAPEGEQLELVVALARVYADAGVLGASTIPPLHASCPSAAECWADIPTAERPTGAGVFDPGSEKGCIFLPWVGPSYRTGGVCVLGMNLRYGGADWELAMEHRIARDSRGGQEASLRADQRAHGSYWATATMRDVVAVLRRRRGETTLEATSGDELADALLASARIQAVKCSPVGGRSSPEAAMSRNCPPRYLRRELEVLRPSVILAYGGPAHAALHHVGQVTEIEAVPRFRRARLDAPYGAVTVFVMTHPAHGGWHPAHRALLASLSASEPSATS